MSYLCGLFPDSVQITTRHCYDDYSIYIPSWIIPSSGLPCKCDRRSTFFTWKIDHNSIKLYQIPTKFGTEVHVNKFFMCIKFHLDQSMHSHFMGENAKCAKWRIKRKKMKKLFQNFAHLYLGICWHDLLQICSLHLPSLGTSRPQVWLNSGKRSWNYIGAKIIFLCLPVNILVVWHNSFLRHTTHYRMSWYSFMRL